MTLYMHTKSAHRSVRQYSVIAWQNFLPFDNNIKQEILETDKANDRLELIKSNLMSMEIEFDTTESGMQ